MFAEVTESPNGAIVIKANPLEIGPEPEPEPEEHFEHLIGTMAENPIPFNEERQVIRGGSISEPETNPDLQSQNQFTLQPGPFAEIDSEVALLLEDWEN